MNTFRYGTIFKWKDSSSDGNDRDLMLCQVDQGIFDLIIIKYDKYPGDVGNRFDDNIMTGGGGRVTLDALHEYVGDFYAKEIFFDDISIHELYERTIKAQQ